MAMQKETNRFTAVLVLGVTASIISPSVTDALLV
jgi:hypothetical protein